jgi:cell division topological specificity factor
MTSLFDRIFGRSRDNSANLAKERLQFVLVHDRVNLPPDQLQAMKQEILAVISKYVNVSNSEVEIALQQHDRHSNVLVAEVPFSKRVIIDPDEDEDPLSKYQPDDEEIDPNSEYAGFVDPLDAVPPATEDDAPTFVDEDDEEDHVSKR